MSHPLLDPKPKTPYVVVGVIFSGGGNRTYFYLAPEDMKVGLGDRVIIAKGQSFSIPTVVGLYPPGGENEAEATDWLVQKIDTGRYEEIKREYAL